MVSQPVSSATLLDANKRLLQLRELHQTTCQLPDPDVWQGRLHDLSRESDVPRKIGLPQLTELLTSLPEHLGWGSVAATAILRKQVREGEVCGNQIAVAEEVLSTSSELSLNLSQEQSLRSASSCQVQEEFHIPHSIKLYPDIGLGMLRQEATAAGRLWLLLHHLDPAGRGALRIDSIVKTITPKSAALRLCGKRQLRNLLRAGDGLFWTRDKEYIWLRSVAKVAVGLGVTRLLGRPLSLPLSVLLDGIGTFRAHLYAAFHSGRRKETQAGSQAMPIARDTLTELSGVGRSSQRTYEAQAGVGVQTHYALGERLTAANEAERAWRQGTAVFQFCDYDGQQGKPGQTYLAWQLPNSYVGGHEQRPKGRQRRINRQLKDLVTKGTPGNVGGASGAQSSRQRYYVQGKQAVQAAARAPQQEVYWRERPAGRAPTDGRFALWRPAGGGR